MAKFELVFIKNSPTATVVTEVQEIRDFQKKGARMSKMKALLLCTP